MNAFKKSVLDNVYSDVIKSEVALPFEWEDNHRNCSKDKHPRQKVSSGLKKHHCCAACKFIDRGATSVDDMCSFHNEPIIVIALACSPLPEWEVVR